MDRQTPIKEPFERRDLEWHAQRKTSSRSEFTWDDQRPLAVQRALRPSGRATLFPIVNVTGNANPVDRLVKRFAATVR